MKLSSPSFNHNQPIPSQYTCDGENINPPLAISNVPTDTQSLVIIMDDPDAPTGTWDHWIVFNIPPETGEISQGQQPTGVQGKGTAGNISYAGPCPPDRKHRYFFKLLALNTMLNLPTGATKQDVETAAKDHIIAQAELIGLYKRQ